MPCTSHVDTILEEALEKWTTGILWVKYFKCFKVLPDTSSHVCILTQGYTPEGEYVSWINAVSKTWNDTQRMDDFISDFNYAGIFCFPHV